MTNITETSRAAGLLAAQAKAKSLLKLIEDKQILQVGASEQELNDQIFALAEKEFGVKKHWHKRIVRAGINTVLPYQSNPENRRIEHNDLVYLDLGPVFDEFEGDVGNTYLLGDDREKGKLVDDLSAIFHDCKRHYIENPAQTGAEFYEYVIGQCRSSGWKYGNSYVGHIVGEFPHKKIYGESPEYSICPQNRLPLNTPMPDGQSKYWILEIHLVESQDQYGGFFEDLLNL
jgi:Xaa-Pro dipeptidase